MNDSEAPTPLPLGRRHHIIKSLKAQADARRSPAEKFADLLTDYFGTVWFLVINMVWFAVWITWNLGLVPGLQPFDPFPFGLLTMVVSLEAIGLAIIVLISQNRASRIADLREEIDLQINTVAEEEVTKIIQLQLKLLDKNGVSIDDPELQQMLSPLSSAQIERSLERELNGTPRNTHKK